MLDERQAGELLRVPSPATTPTGPSILDFQVDDVDAEHERIAAMGVTSVLPPTTQPWGSRAMIFTDPDGNLINVFSST